MNLLLAIAAEDAAKSRRRLSLFAKPSESVRAVGIAVMALRAHSRASLEQGGGGSPTQPKMS
jgi:hypothetical protein